MQFNEKLKLLRKERDVSQEELGNAIKLDSRQISRYENEKMMPSTDVLMKIADFFNISTDYLLFDDLSRRPLRHDNNDLVEKFFTVTALSDNDKQAITHILDSFSAKNKIKDVVRSIN